MALQSRTITVGADKDVNNGGKNYVSGQVIYIKNEAGVLAPIFRDIDGLDSIAQNTISNVTNAKGQFTFFIEEGNYTAEYNDQSTPLFVFGADYFNNQIDFVTNQILSNTQPYSAGSFTSGFTFTELNQYGNATVNDGGTDYATTFWYIGGTLPHTVAPLTNPRDFPLLYQQRDFNSAEFVATKTTENAQDFIDSFVLKIFQSPTDGLTEINTRTLLGGQVYEVRKASDGSFADIYTDKEGLNPISQNGTSNVSGSDGVVEFFIADGDYYVGVDANVKSFSTRNGIFDNKDELEGASRLSSGDVVSLNSYYAGYAATMDGAQGGGLRLIVTRADYGREPDGFGEFYIGGGNELVCTIVKSVNVSAYHFGAKRDSSFNNSSIFQSYAEWCDLNGQEFTLDGGVDPDAEYLVDTVTTFNTAVSIRGRGSKRPRILAVNCDLFNYGLGAKEVNITGIRAAQATRHTTFANTYFSVKFTGDTTNRPYYNNINNCLFDGFGRTLVTQWAWEQRFTDNIILNCGSALVGSGITVNNHFTANECTGNGLAIQLGDGSNAVEGWWILENLMDGFIGMDIIGGAYNKINDNIIDHLKGGTGILLRSGTGLPSAGNKVNYNYIAFDATGNEGIRLLNNVDSSANKGNTVIGNEIFSYAGTGLGKGILTDGSFEKAVLIQGNTIKADAADIDTADASDCKVLNNDMDGAGYRGSNVVEYSANSGAIITSEALLKKSSARAEFYDNAMPTAGVYIAGDTVHKLQCSVDANSMMLIGWKRLTTGSGHVLGTDWVGMFVSVSSPAV